MTFPQQPQSPPTVDRKRPGLLLDIASVTPAPASPGKRMRMAMDVPAAPRPAQYAPLLLTPRASGNSALFMPTLPDEDDLIGMTPQGNPLPSPPRLKRRLRASSSFMEEDATVGYMDCPVVPMVDVIADDADQTEQPLPRIFFPPSPSNNEPAVLKSLPALLPKESTLGLTNNHQDCFPMLRPKRTHIKRRSSLSARSA
ncbi:expressed unknown protein [Seminavis robusta]|uniref:Uncharacterized protein n=1 Tax=Seminavis robusta TaxID=568900 RepID=A0A9N8F3Y5_9STRA|nr:expressed unknown protein [Seminavis robusta]|eukprot:Sro3398_g347570.1 n/a (199) ;mRNA; f:1402-1998